MKTTKATLYRFLSVCLTGALLCVLLAGCGARGNPTTEEMSSKSTGSGQSVFSASSQTESQVSSQPETSQARESSQGETPTDVDFSKYDGFAYYQEDGTLKYALKLDNGFQMRCNFVSGDPEPYEEIYTMDLSTAELSGNTIAIRTIRDGQGLDISDRFRTLTYTFLSDKVIMIVERDESTLAGGAGDNVLTGTYTFAAAKQEPNAPAEKNYTPKELCAMAQDYYEKHNDFRPPVADSASNSDGTVTIHLYEIVSNGDGTFHTATSAWYTVDSKGVGTDDITGESVRLAE